MLDRHRLPAEGDLLPSGYLEDKAGRVKDVSISYPHDLLKQQLAWARENGTVGF